MNKKKLKQVAKEIYELELECQKGNNIEENMKKMNELTSNLNVVDILEMAVYLENKFQN